MRKNLARSKAIRAAMKARMKSMTQKRMRAVRATSILTQSGILARGAPEKLVVAAVVVERRADTRHPSSVVGEEGHHILCLKKRSHKLKQLSKTNPKICQTLLPCTKSLYAIQLVLMIVIHHLLALDVIDRNVVSKEVDVNLLELSAESVVANKGAEQPKVSSKKDRLKSQDKKSHEHAVKGSKENASNSTDQFIATMKSCRNL